MSGRPRRKRIRKRGSGDPTEDRPAKVGTLLESVLQNAGVVEGVERAQITTEWAERVGEQIAEVTEVRGFSGDTLFVEVRSSAWAMELGLMRHDIIARLNAGRSGARIERIVFLQAGTE